MNLFITGINGFLGSSLARYFKSHGHVIKGTTSRKSGISRDIIYYRLGDNIQTEAFKNIDVVIHCAHSFDDSEASKNISGASDIAYTAHKEGVKKQIYISSLSARPDALSQYGISKFQAEQQLKSIEGMIIIRPGTIVGNGGLFAKMAGSIQKLPVAPLINGGKNLLYLIGIQHLTEIISTVADERYHYKNEINLYYHEQISMKNLLTTFKIIFHKRTLLIYFPVNFLMFVLKTSERIGLKLPVKSDNLIGYVTSQKMIHNTDVDYFLPNFDLNNNLESFLKNNILN